MRYFKSILFLFFSISFLLSNVRYIECAEIIDSEQQYKLGLQYLNGDGVKQNYYEASLHIQIAALQGHPEAQAVYGDMFYFGRGIIQDKKAAYDWYKRAANGGSINGAYGLGQWYENEDGTEDNMKTAIDLYKKAAEAGHSGAQFSLANQTVFGCRNLVSDNCGGYSVSKRSFGAKWDALSSHIVRASKCRCGPEL